MNSRPFEAACAALVAARRGARTIDPYPAEWQPADVGEAYRLQTAAAAGLGGVGGWKIAAVTEAQRSALGVPCPLGAPVLAGWMRDARSAEAELRVADFIAPKLECEFAFELAADLPPRPGQPYTRAEVEAATGALRLAIEVVDSRLPPRSGVLAELADFFNNGALVCGPALRGWQSLAYAHIGIRLHAVSDDGARELALGSGAAILEGDPFGTVVMLANAQFPGGPGLRAGDIVTTGSCTGAPPLPGPGLYRAEFAGLGEVALRFLA